MGFYEDQVLPRLVHVTLGGRQFDQVRGRVAAGLAGDVLEVGFGSGLNVPHYPLDIRKVQAVDPAVVGQKLAAKKVAESPVPIEYIGLDGQSLPVETATIDHVLITWMMCTISDVGSALSETLRVLRPGGELHFVEHGRSPDPKVAHRQDQFTPIQKRIFGGCHLNRPIDQLVAAAGFELTHMDNYYMKGPKAFGYMYEGTATKPIG